MKNVLFIAGLKEEYYYMPFVRACTGKNITIYLFDPSCFPRQAIVSMIYDGQGINGFI